MLNLVIRRVGFNEEMLLIHRRAPQDVSYKEIQEFPSQETTSLYPSCTLHCSSCPEDQRVEAAHTVALLRPVMSQVVAMSKTLRSTLMLSRLLPGIRLSPAVAEARTSKPCTFFRNQDIGKITTLLTPYVSSPQCTSRTGAYHLPRIQSG